MYSVLKIVSMNNFMDTFGETKIMFFAGVQSQTLFLKLPDIKHIYILYMSYTMYMSMLYILYIIIYVYSIHIKNHVLIDYH